MAKPFANARTFNGELLDSYIFAIQAGTTTGDDGLSEMCRISLKDLRAYVRQGFGNAMNFRGAYSSALPADPVTNDYFYASATFTAGSVTYTSGRFYEFNGTEWSDISGILGQYVTLAQAVQTAQDQINSLALLKSQLEHTLTNDSSKVPASDAVYGAISGISTWSSVSFTEATQSNYTLDNIKVYKCGKLCVVSCGMQCVTAATSHPGTAVLSGLPVPVSDLYVSNPSRVGSGKASLRLGILNGTVYLRYGEAGCIYDVYAVYPCSQ